MGVKKEAAAAYLKEQKRKEENRKWKQERLERELKAEPYVVVILLLGFVSAVLVALNLSGVWS